MSKKTVVYVAWGESFIAEANISMQSVKRHTTDVSSVLMCGVGEKKYAKGFDKVHELPISGHWPSDKVNGIYQASHLQEDGGMLYLDTDTIAIGNLDDLFEVPYEFDIGMAHAPFRRTPGIRSSVPAVYPDFNAGVIVFNPEKVRTLFKDWRIGVSNKQDDQHVLTYMLYFYYHGMRLLVLPPEYNVRWGWPCYLQSEAKILHGKGNSSGVHSVINEKPNAGRVWIPDVGMRYKKRDR